MWVDHRADPDGDVYVQRVDDAGRPAWAESGVAVCTASGPQSKPVLAADGEGGAFVAWSDRRSGTWRVYVQHLAPDGVPTLEPNGQPISVDDDIQVEPSIAQNAGSDAMIVWVAFGMSGPVTLRGQRFDRAGNTFWGASGVAIDSSLTAAMAALTPDLVSGGADGALVVVHSEPIWSVRRFDGNGHAMWPFAVSPCDTCKPTDMVFASDGAGGVTFAWNEAVGETSGVFAQHVRVNGTRAWGNNGVIVKTGVVDGLRLSAAADDATFLVCRDFGAANPRITAQRLDSSGVAAWGESGIRLAHVGREQDQASLVSDHAGGIIVAWQAARAGEPTNIFGQRLGLEGTLQWDPDGAAVAPPLALRMNPRTISTGDGGGIIFWNEGSLRSRALCAQRLNGLGFPGTLPGSNLGRTVFLWSAAPTPMRDVTTIRFATRTTVDVQLIIHDVSGRRVRELLHESAGTGLHSIVWDGRDDHNRPVASGLYFVSLQTPAGSLSTRLVVQ